MPGKLYRLTGDGIAPAPWFTIHDFEGPEANDVNAFPFLQTALDDIKHQIDQTKRIAICQAAVTRVNKLRKIGLGHCPNPLFKVRREVSVHPTARLYAGQGPTRGAYVMQTGEQCQSKGSKGRAFIEMSDEMSDKLQFVVLPASIDKLKFVGLSNQGAADQRPV